MGSQEILAIAMVGIGLGLVVMLLIVARMWLTLHRMNASFAKLGFVIREDAKKYFDDAADKIVDTNESFRLSYEKIVAEGTATALAKSGEAMGRSLTDAHEKANGIILGARSDAQQIIQSSRTDAAAEAKKVLDRADEAVSWIMTEYVGSAYSVAEHEALIEKQVRKYVDEHRQ